MPYPEFEEALAVPKCQLQSSGRDPWTQMPFVQVTGATDLLCRVPRPCGPAPSWRAARASQDRTLPAPLGALHSHLSSSLAAFLKGEFPESWLVTLPSVKTLPGFRGHAQQREAETGLFSLISPASWLGFAWLPHKYCLADLRTHLFSVISEQQPIPPHVQISSNPRPRAGE